MLLPDGMRKHGFRKWYERELIQSHLHLVLAFLCLIGVFAAMEAYSGNDHLDERLFDILSVLLCTGVGVWSLRRYLYLLSHAEGTANQAVCPQCQAYGRFAMVSEDREQRCVTVRCRACGRHWRIDH